MDCFVNEPVTAPHRFGKLENVILAPHAICWTDELFRGNGRAACRSILAVARGEVPRDVVNRAALERPGLQAKLARYREGER